jgi:hypothetical protein
MQRAVPRNCRIHFVTADIPFFGGRKMRTLYIAVIALILSGGSAPAATLADVKTGFSAVRTLIIDGKSYVGRMIAMPGKERHEQQIQGFEPVFLLRTDRAFGEAVLAKLHTIVQFGIPAELRMLAAKELKKAPAGPETINGIATTKYLVDETTAEGHATGSLWLSADGIPMRLAGNFAAKNGKVSTVRWELSQVKIGPQPDSLFEAPSGYAKLPPEAIAPLLGMRLKSASH